MQEKLFDCMRNLVIHMNVVLLYMNEWNDRAVHLHDFAQMKYFREIFAL